MCGIAGIISSDKQEVSTVRLKKMTDAIAHRGPDGEGQWLNKTNNVGLAHRRLSIIDLSEHAGQPMHYMDRYSIIFNGEIYNYLELKEELLKDGYAFKTASDTEVLMALYDKYKESCLEKLDGMFAFAIYDEKVEEVFFARDRFGEKPFFYSYKPGAYFLFGSEMKALWAAGISKTVNNTMLYNYLSFGYLQNPENDAETFYENCYRLSHANFLILSVKDCTIRKQQQYYRPAVNDSFNLSADKAQEKFSELFYTSVQRRLRSDVPVGSSLSGGLDSSLVVTVIDQLKKGSNQVQKTFSACFPGYKKDESRFMKLVTDATKTEPHYVYPREEGLIKSIDIISHHQEEPFGSASIYAQYCVMEEAKRNNITVLLDGQGADEYLAGYPAYLTAYFNDLRKNHPGIYKTEYNDYLKLHNTNDINGTLKKDLKYYIRTFTPGLITTLKKSMAAYQHKKSSLLSEDFYAEYRRHNFKDELKFSNLNLALQQSVFDGGLQVLLRYADRNSMAHSREVRLPFLFHELVDFVFTLPPHFKIHEGWSKWIMRSTFQNLLPNEIVWRKDKIGYEPPQKDWLSNPAMQERIHFGKETLYKEGIISRRQLDSAIVATDAINDKSKTWAMLMAGNLYIQ